MTNKEILDIALQQSAYDCNCDAADFLSEQDVVTLSKANPKARKYIPLPLECDIVSYGNNVVAQVSERTKSAVSEYINKFDVYRCFETPQINMLNDLLAPFDLKVCFIAEYFLPDVTKLKALGARSLGTGQGAVLLRRLVECQIGTKCYKKRLSPCVG